MLINECLPGGRLFFKLKKIGFRERKREAERERGKKEKERYERETSIGCLS